MSNPEQSLDEDADVAHRRAWWRSRRGMLEIDVFLVPFVTERYPALTAEDRAVYHRLLESEDTSLHLWLTGKGDPEDTGLREIVDAIREHAAQRPV